MLAARYRLRYDPAALFRAEGFLAGPDEHRLAELHAALARSRGAGGLRRAGRVRPPAPAAAPGSAAPAAPPQADRRLLRRDRAAGAGGARRAWPRCTARWSPSSTRLPEEDLQALFGLLERPGRGLLLSGLETPRARAGAGAAAGRQPRGVLPPAGHALPARPRRRRPVPRGHRRAALPDRSPDHPPRSGGGLQRGRRRWWWASSRTAASARARTLASPPVEEVLEERLGRLAIPVVRGGQFGHGARNTALPYGTLVELDTRHGTLVALEGAVS